jgi:hypothetical protein
MKLLFALLLVTIENWRRLARRLSAASPSELLVRLAAHI